MATAFEIDDRRRAVLVDLFTEIAVLEHLVRNWLSAGQPLEPAEFGVLNYFCRHGKSEEPLSALALCFEVAVPDMASNVAALAARGWLTVGNENDPCVRITDAGRAEYEVSLADVTPQVLEVVEEFDPAHLEITASTLKELRRTIENLPDR